MLNNQPPQALQSLIGGGAQAPMMGASAAASGTSSALSGGKPGWGLNEVLGNHFLGLDKDAQKDFLKSFDAWDEKAWWDGSKWVDPKQKADPDAKTDDPNVDTTWLDDVQNVRDKGPTGLSDSMKKNLGYGTVTPGMTKSTGLATSGYTKYAGDPVVTKPKPDLGRPDETGMRPNFPNVKPRQASPMQGTGMSDVLAKLIGG